VRSLIERPTRTAEDDIGSERNRSMIPLFRSAAIPTAVMIEPKTAVCTKTPGIR
jgi:hypothetical protein